MLDASLLSFALRIVILDGIYPSFRIMDVLGKVTTDCIALIYTSSTIYRAGRRLATRQQQELLRRHYGAFCASLIASLSPETAAQYESIHRHILQGRKEEAMSFRQAITDECNMTAVAVSLASPEAIHSLMYMKMMLTKAQGSYHRSSLNHGTQFAIPQQYALDIACLLSYCDYVGLSLRVLCLRIATHSWKALQRRANQRMAYDAGS